MEVLTEDQQKEMRSLTDELDALIRVIEQREEEVNEKIGNLNEVLQRYNNVLRNVDGFLSKAVNEMQSYYNTQSDPWTAKNGKKFLNWVDDWENFDITPLELVDEIEQSNVVHSELLRDLKLRPE